MKKLFFKAFFVSAFLGLAGCPATNPVRIEVPQNTQSQTLGPNESALRDYINSPEYNSYLLKQQRERDEWKELRKQQENDNFRN